MDIRRELFQIQQACRRCIEEIRKWDNGNLSQQRDPYQREKSISDRTIECYLYLRIPLDGDSNSHLPQTLEGVDDHLSFLFNNGFSYRVQESYGYQPIETTSTIKYLYSFSNPN